MEYGNLYLLNAWGTNKYKIGVTKNNVEKRIKQLQTGCPDEIILINQYKSDVYRKIESWLHRKFKSKKVEGEWFILDDSDVINFITECVNAEKTIKLLLNENPFFK
jgi:hypothetical protein